MSSNSKPFLTVQTQSSFELNVEHSRFIGHCREVAGEEEAKAFIAEIRNEHAQATHNCYAYRIGTGEHPLEYFNDHGEPSGTAGKPILGAIQRLNLTNVVVVVTRYFGGKKLGVRGLIEAYAAAANGVLEKAGVVTRIPRFTVTLVYNYPEHSQILYRLQQIKAEVLESEYTDVVKIAISVPEENREVLMGLVSEFPSVKINW